MQALLGVFFGVGHESSQTQRAQAPASNKVLALLQTDSFLQNRSTADALVAREFKTLAPSELPKVIDSFLKYIGDKIHLLDPVSLADRLNKLITCEKVNLAYASRQSTPEEAARSALKSAKSMYGAAAHYLSVTDSKVPVSIKSYFTSFMESLLSLVETLLAVYGIGDLFKSSDNNHQNDMKLQKVITLINSFSLFTVTLQPLLGAIVTSCVVGGSLFLIAALSLAYPFIKPATTNPPLAQNITRQIEKGQVIAVEGRKAILDKMAACLSARSHVLLIGKSRVGKTLLVKAFAEAVRRGDYPSLAGKYVCLVKTPELIPEGRAFNSYGESATGLGKLSEAIQPSRESYILAFDEIHVACQAERHKALAEQFKPLLDTDDPKNFPFAIGLTTKAEYDAYVRPNEAFSNRFTVINVDNTNRLETLQIESNTLLKKSPKTLLENGAHTLEYLYEETNKHFKVGGEDPVQPNTSLKILKRCMDKTSEMQESPLAEEVSKIRGKIASLRAQAAISSISSQQDYDEEALEESLRLHIEALTKQKEQLQVLYDARTKLFTTKIALMKSICKLSKCNPESLSTQEKVELSRYILLRECSEKLESALKVRAKKLNVHLCIDKELIDKTIQEELENQKSVQEALKALEPSRKRKRVEA